MTDCKVLSAEIHSEEDCVDTESDDHIETDSLSFLIEDYCKEKYSDLHNQLYIMKSKQTNILRIIDRIKQDFELNTKTIPKYVRQITDYRSRLINLKIHMTQISQKIEYLQNRLNKIRLSLPPSQFVMMEQPLEHGIDEYFYYRCIIQSGLKFRTKPSTSAPIINGLHLKYNDIVAVSQRVFICHEETIFLHVNGYGWLFENIDNVLCMEHIGPSHGLLGCFGKSIEPFESRKNSNISDRMDIDVDIEASSKNKSNITPANEIVDSSSELSPKSKLKLTILDV